MTAELNRRALLAVGVVSAASCRSAQAAEPGRTEEQMRTDWPWLGRYAAENAALRSAGTKVEMVLLGDSITENWSSSRPNFFEQGWIGRGIKGQTTPQMVLRMMSDVVAHRPRFLHILGGTNDVAQNTGPISAEETADNLRMIAYIARQEKIRVLIGALPPAADFPWRPGLQPAKKIVAINAMLKSLAEELRARWIDYHAALSDAKGGMDSKFTADGVHPNSAGYAVMEELFLRSAPRELLKGQPAR